MLKAVTIFVFTLAVCYADPIPSQDCSRSPKNVFVCMGSPEIFTEAVLLKCAKPWRPCDKYECLFTESGWLKDDKVDKKKVSDYFDTFASTHTAWSAAVTYLKEVCLGDNEQASKGDPSCPAGDIAHCIHASFLKKALPSQWLPGPECADAREYANCVAA